MCMHTCYAVFSALASTQKGAQPCHIKYKYSRTTLKFNLKPFYFFSHFNGAVRRFFIRAVLLFVIALANRE